MPLINADSLAQFIVPFNSTDLKLSEEDKAVLKNAVYKMKCDQLLALVQDILPLFSIFEDEEQIQPLLQLITLESIDKKDLDSIFKIDFIKREEDLQLKTALANLGKNEDDFYTVIYNFRHMYFLNKKDKVRNNPEALPERVSDRKLVIGHSYITKYLRSWSGLTEQESTVINKVFPFDSLKKNHIFRKNAHDTIKLGIYEIQSLILSMVKATVHTGVVPQENLQFYPMNESNTFIYRRYHGEIINFLLKSDFNDLKSHINTETLSNAFSFYNRCSLLIASVKTKKSELVKYLLSLGSNTEHQDDYGCTALHYAVISNEEIFSAVLSASKNVNIENEGGYTPLYWAAEFGTCHQVKLLLDKGADPNLTNNRYKATPAHAAARKSRADIVNVFLASTKFHSGLKDKSGHSVFDYLKHNPALNKSLSSMQAASNQSFATTAKPAAGYSPMKVYVSDLLHALKRPREGKAYLLKNRQIWFTCSNPFPVVVYGDVNQKTDSIYNCFNEMIEETDNFFKKSLIIFGKAITEITALKEDQIQSPAKKYQRLLLLLTEAIKLGISPTALSFEMYRLDLIDQLILLESKKGPLEYAIDLEDTEIIKMILAEQSNREAIKVIYKKNIYSELYYAVITGKTIAVKVMLESAEANPEIKLGPIPDNALFLAESREEEISAANKAFLEAEDFYDINIPLASKINVINLLRQLIATLPHNNNSIQGLFTPEEYPIFRILVGEAEDMVRKTPLIAKLANKIRAIKILKERLFLMERLEQPDEEEKHLTLTALNLLSKNPYKNIKKIRDSIAVPQSLPKARNIFKHATNRGDEIKKEKQILPVQLAIDEKKVLFSSTPEGTRQNIFFSQNSPKASLTPLRQKAQHVIEVDISQAVNHKLIDPSAIYTSPHIPAFKIERVEQPIIFIGDDPNKKTIYRIYHLARDNTLKKVHLYDYYHHGALISSQQFINNMEDEFFVGHNIKVTAYRLLLQLRRIKGPFESGSYYHYILNNKENLDVIDSARAALFNVLNVEGKISKKFEIDHPAVEIKENSQNNLYEPLPENAVSFIKQLITEDKLEDLITYIESFKITNQQLEFALSHAIFEQNLALVKYFLDLGVSPFHPKNAIFRVACFKVVEASKLKKEETVFENATRIMALLLQYGNSDLNDPKHIRYGVQADRISLIGDDQPSWINTSESDVRITKILLTSHDREDFHKLLLSCMTRNLLELHKFTFMHALEYHQFISFRLQRPSLYTDKDIVSLLKCIRENDVSTILNFLEPLTVNEIEEHFYIISHAILWGLEEMTTACFKFFIATAAEKEFSSLNLSLRFKQTAIFKALLPLYMNIQPTINFHNSLDLALRFNLDECVDILLEEMLFDNKILLKLIENRKMANAKNFITKLDLTPLVKRQYHQNRKNLTKNQISKETNDAEAPQNPFIKFHNDVFDINLSKFEKPNSKTPKEDNHDSLINTLIYVIKSNDEELIKICLSLYREKLSKSNRRCYLEVLITALEFVIKSKNTFLFMLFMSEILNNRFHSKNFMPYLESFYAILLYHDDNETILDVFLKMLIKSDIIGSNTSFEFSKDLNFLHLAICYGNVNKVALIRKHFPFLSYTTSKVTLSRLLRLLILNNPNPVAMLNFLATEITFSLTNVEKIQLALQAPRSNRANVLKWLYDNHILNEDVSFEGKNILHCICYDLASSHYVNVDSVAFADCINYLCDVIGMNINEKDCNGATILDYYCNNQNSINEYPRTSLILCTGLGSNTSLTVLLQRHDIQWPHNDSKDPFIFFLLQYPNNLQYLEMYVKGGGDLQIKNTQGFNLHEYSIFYRCPNNLTDFFLSHNITTRPNIPLPSHYFVVSCKVNDVCYFLSFNDQSFVIEYNDIMPSDLISLLPRSKEIINLSDAQFHWKNMGTLTKLPNTQICGLKGTWVEYPQGAKPTVEGTITFMNGSKTYEINTFSYTFMEIIRSIYNSNRVIKPKLKKCRISDAPWELLYTSSKRVTTKLELLYQSIFDLHNDNPSLEVLESIQTSDNDTEIKNMPYRVAILCKGQSLIYENVTLYSPLSALIILNKLDVFKKLLESGMKILPTHNIKFSPMQHAIERGVLPNLLLSLKTNITDMTASFLFNCLHFATEKGASLKTINTLLTLMIYLDQAVPKREFTKWVDEFNKQYMNTLESEDLKQDSLQAIQLLIEKNSPCKKRTRKIQIEEPHTFKKQTKSVTLVPGTFFNSGSKRKRKSLPITEPEKLQRREEGPNSPSQGPSTSGS